MNHVQISHPALVALQGRLRLIALIADRMPTTNTNRAPLVSQARKGIAEIDQWLTDPAKQVPAIPSYEGIGLDDKGNRI